MPDVDVISRRLPPKWRRAGNLIRGASPPATVGDSIVGALADTLRRGGGCPPLGDLAQAAHQVLNGLDAEALDRASQQASHEARGRPNYQTVLVACEVTQSLMATGELSGLTGEEVAHRIAAAFLERLAHSNLIDRLAPALMRESAQSLDEVLTYLGECVADANLDALADRLLTHQDGKGLRAPARRAPRRSTADILHAPLGPPGAGP